MFMNPITMITLLCGGLAFFLYGMSVMSSGLEKMAGGKLERLLRKSTSNPFKSLLLGAGITIAIQSSSAMTVMLVGLVNSGIMQLGQTIGVIMGSNIGTTLTAWILALNGMESENLFLSMLKPEAFSLVLALIGIGMIMMSKSDKKQSIGSIMVGFAVLIYGMEMMGDAVKPLAEMDGFKNILTAFNNPLLGVLVGAVFTGVIQSSAASVGILMGFANTGLITFGMAAPIVMGQNIGTCVTALISSIGVTKNAKRVAVVHITFNLVGTAVFLLIYCAGNAIFDFAFANDTVNSVAIAAIHTVFNVCTTIMLLPFSKMLEKAANFFIKDAKGEEDFSFIDQRLLATPSVAVAECDRKTREMARMAKDTLVASLGLLTNYDEKLAEKLIQDEDQLDFYEDKLGTCLVQLSRREISAEDSKRVSKQLHTIGNFERIGDHALDILMAAKEIHEKNVRFSSEAVRELTVATSALTEILEITVDAFCREDLELATTVEPLEQVIDYLMAKMKARHIERLQVGKCTIELGFILSDILNNYERISDHCSNIAVALIETKQNAYEAHEYLNGVKQAGDVEYQQAYMNFRQKYALK
jgi:phosphate:Na+ symporter